jgi:predicted component of type VI protein secretion system
MKCLQPVIWSKGTFLTPQHLQVQDRILDNALPEEVVHLQGLESKEGAF